MFILNVLGPLLLSIEVSDPYRTSDKLAVFFSDDSKQFA